MAAFLIFSPLYFRHNRNQQVFILKSSSVFFFIWYETEAGQKEQIYMYNEYTK